VAYKKKACLVRGGTEKRPHLKERQNRIGNRGDHRKKKRAGGKAYHVLPWKEKG